MRKKTVLFFIGILAILTPIGAQASQEGHAIISLSRNAWITHADSSTPSSASVGDLLQNGDRLETLRGNTAQVAINPEGEDLINLDENTALTIRDSELYKAVVLEKGKVFASLNKLKDGSNFKVYTPTAIAVVRGTQFAVILTNNMTSVLSYVGRVEVTKRAPDGSPAKDSITLSPGEKTLVGSENLKAEEMSRAEMEDLQSTAALLPAAPAAKKSQNKAKVIISSHFDELSK